MAVGACGGVLAAQVQGRLSILAGEVVEKAR